MRCAFLSSVRHQEDRPVALDPYPVFRRGHTLFHSECHLGDYVQEFGDEQCRCGSLHRPPLPSLGNQAALVAFCGHHPDKTLVDSPDPGGCSTFLCPGGPDHPRGNILLGCLHSCPGDLLTGTLRRYSRRYSHRLCPGPVNILSASPYLLTAHAQPDINPASIILSVSEADYYFIFAK